MRRSHFNWFTALLLALSSGAVMGACSEKEQPQPKEEPKCAPLTKLMEPENALSEELMASLGQAQNFHGKADVLVDSGDLEQAAATVAMILDIPFPENAPEAEDVMADTRARLAKLYAELGQLERAMAVVEVGIASSDRQSFYLANLHTVRGQILQAMAKEAQTEPDSEDAQVTKARVDSIRKEAIKAFELSNKIHEALLETLDPGESP